MNVILKLFWGSLAGFLLSFMVGIWNYNNDVGTISLVVMLCCMVTFLVSMLGIADGEAEEGQNEHFARCLSCSNWLNGRIHDYITSADVEAKSAGDQSLKLKEVCMPLTDANALEMRRNFPVNLKQFELQKQATEALLRQLKSKNHSGAKLLADAEASVAICKAGFALRGRWRTGHPVAGEYILADKIEPQQITAILCQPLRLTVNTGNDAYKTLHDDLAAAESHFQQLASNLAK
jgi:hypothetical protein